MFLDVLLGSKATWRILVLMSEAPGMRLSRPEIKRLTRLGNNAVTESLKDLVVHGILNMKREGRKTAYGFDLTDETAKLIIGLCAAERKGLNNLPYQYSLVLREYVRMTLSLCVPKRIVLFGSVAKRVYREDSDIDIAVVLGEELPAQTRLDMEDVTTRLKKRFGMEIQQHFFALNEFEKAEDKLIAEIRKDGIDLL
jgi:predicted nucleotidyltransferase